MSEQMSCFFLFLSAIRCQLTANVFKGTQNRKSMANLLFASPLLSTMAAGYVYYVFYTACFRLNSFIYPSEYVHIGGIPKISKQGISQRHTLPFTFRLSLINAPTYIQTAPPYDQFPFSNTHIPKTTRYSSLL